MEHITIATLSKVEDENLVKEWIGFGIETEIEYRKDLENTSTDYVESVDREHRLVKIFEQLTWGPNAL